MDRSLPGSSVHGILQARILEWVAIPFSRGSSWPRDQTRAFCIASHQGSLFMIKVKVKSLSHVRLFVTPWTVAYQAPPSMGFSRQECWSGLPFPSPRKVPPSQPRNRTRVSCIAGRRFTVCATREAQSSWLRRTAILALLNALEHDACLLAFSNNKGIRENFFANRGNTCLLQPVLTFY